jgi:hypothetical protein
MVRTNPSATSDANAALSVNPIAPRVVPAPSLPVSSSGLSITPPSPLSESCFAHVRNAAALVRARDKLTQQGCRCSSTSTRAAEVLDHLVTPEKRYEFAMARQ